MTLRIKKSYFTYFRFIFEYEILSDHTIYNESLCIDTIILHV